MAQGSAGGLDQLSGWIGREVRTTAPVWFDQTPLTLNVAGRPDADEVRLVTLDARGNEISREEIGAGDGEIDWLGRDAQGNLLPAGKYMFRVESIKDGEVIGTSYGEAFTRVTGVELVNGTPRLTLTGGATAELDEISALRE
jgi:flagellar basal-body rod modification protein FlgD